MSSDDRKVLLGEVINHKKGFAFKSSDYRDNGIPVIRISNFTENSIDSKDLRFVSTNTANLNSSVVLKANDIVIATVGSWPSNPASVVGRTILVPEWVAGGLMNQNSVIIRSCSKDQIDQIFIYYHMKSKVFSEHIISKAQGSANQASITLEAIFSYPLWWPTKVVRKSISQTLKSLDDRITLLRETNQTLEAIAQAIFKSWFVDFDPVRAKMEGRQPVGMDEDTAALFPDELVESELGLIPKGWVVSKLGAVTEKITKGTTPTTIKKSFTASGINFVKVEAISEQGELLPQKFSFIDEETNEALKRSQLQSGDILVTIAGTIGRMAEVYDDFLPANTNQAVAIIRTRQDILPSGFIKRFLAQRQNILHFKERTVQAVQANLSLGSLAGTPLVIPPHEFTRELHSIVFGPLDELVKLNAREARVLSDLRDTLLPRLISGKLRVPVDETEAVTNEE